MKVAVVLAVVIGLLGVALRYGPETDPGHRLIAALASGQRVGSLGWLRVSDVEGDPWSTFTVGRIEIVDRQGAWLSAGDIAVRWRPGALWTRQVRITDLSVRAITLLRQPVLLPARPQTPSPVSVRVDRATATIELTPQFAWRRGEYRVDAAVDIGRDSAASGKAHAVSLTHPGDFLGLDFNLGRAAIDLEAHAREALGGAIAGSLGLDPDKPFGLDAQAHGSPQAGQFTLTTSVGARVPAEASGRWGASGGEALGRLDLGASRWLIPWSRRLGTEANFRLTATRAAGSLYQAVFEGRGANLVLTAAGEVDPGHRRTGPKGVTLGLATPDLSALAGVSGLGGAKASGLLTGDDSHWRLAGAAATDRVKAAGLSLAGASATFLLVSAPGAATAHLEVLGAGGSGASPLAVLLGAAPRASADIQAFANGRLLVRRFMVHGAGVDAQGQGERGLFGDLSFKGQAQVQRLAVAAPGTEGRVLADWSAGQSRDKAPWTFNLRARGEGLRLGSAEAESLLGPAPNLAVTGQYGGGGLRIDRSSLRGAGLSMTAAGGVGGKGDLRLNLLWTTGGSLVLGPLSISGSSEGSGDLSGTIDRPRLDLMADFKAIDLPDLPALRLRQARLALTLTGENGGVAGRVGLGAQTDNGPAKAAGDFRFAAGEVILSQIDVDAGGGVLRGGATLQKGEPTQADLTLAVGPGVFLDKGHVDGRVQITPSGAGARARVALRGADLVLPGGTGEPASLTFTANGPLEHLPYQVEARGAGAGFAGRIAGSGLLIQATDERTVTFTGTGRMGAVDFSTRTPARVVLARSGVTGDANLTVGGGEADITLQNAGGALTARASLAGLDLAMLDPDFRGRVDGVLNLKGAGGAIAGDADVKVSNLTGRDSEGAAPIGGSLKATFGGGAVVVQTRLADTKGSKMSADVRVPARLSVSPFQFSLEDHGPISGRFSADGEIGPWWDFIEGGGATMTGRLTADGAIGGTLADPRLTGTAGLGDGDFEDPGVGLTLKGLAFRANLLGDAVDVVQLTAADGAKGSISGSGRLSLLRAGASGFRLNLKDFRLIDSPLVQAAASGTVNVDRAADGKVRLGGALTIDRAQISPTPPTPSGVVPMEVVEVHGPVRDTASVAAPKGREPPITLDIGLKAPGGIFIKGRGLNMELSLDAKVSGSSAAPVLSGVARVTRGEYDFAGKRFQISDGGAVYLGSTAETIRLDISATRDDPTLTAVIRIQGTAAAPTLTLTSTPALPKDEVLSQVLFGASASQLSGLEAAQLASALAGMTKGGGFDVIGGLRNFAHLDRLAIDSGATTGTVLAGGKYLTDRIYLELQSGARIGQGAQVEWRLKKHVAIVSRVTTNGDQAVSVRWRKDY